MVNQLEDRKSELNIQNGISDTYNMISLNENSKDFLGKETSNIHH